MPTFSSLQEAREFREQLSSARRRTGFLFGAGTSQAVGLDGIWQLTENVCADLKEDLRDHYKRLLGDAGPKAHVEHVLNSVRLYRELLGDSDREVGGLSGAGAARLDSSICSAILNRVAIDPPKGLQPHLDFANWVRSVDRTMPVEIFTTNYDLLIERALERTLTPHFDGFIGTYEPHFVAASVDSDSEFPGSGLVPPASWVRVWKLHGSVGWRMIDNGKDHRIVRVPHREAQAGEDLLIYPSREKYDSSRRQPYVTYQDRLRRFLLSGEALLVIAGYSFGDQHINEIIFEGLRTNNRLAVTALLYGDLNDDIRTNLLEPCDGYRNLTVYSGDHASVAGVLGRWEAPGDAPPQYGTWPFWSADRFTLGDFSNFSEYLRVFLGVSELGGARAKQTAVALPVAGFIGGANSLFEQVAIVTVPVDSSTQP